MKPADVISGLYETHVNVSNLEQSMRFYGDVLGLVLATRDIGRKLAFYWIGEPGRAFLGLWEKPALEVVTQHFAFEVPIADLPAAVGALRASDVEVRNFFNVVTDIPSVFGWMPAASVYFADPDGHLLELLARLPGSSRPEVGIVSLDEWQRLTGPAAERAG